MNCSVAERLDELVDEGHLTTAHIELTKRCNGSCSYCYPRKWNEEPDDEMSPETVLHLVDQLADHGIFSVLITGGEPFIRPDFLEILGRIFSRGFFRVVIFTNGTLIGEKALSFLVNNKRMIDQMQLSIFSHEPEIHDRLIGINGGYEKTIAVATKLKAAGIPVKLAINVIDETCHSYEDTAKYLNDLGFAVNVGFSILKKRAEEIPNDDLFFAKIVSSMEKSRLQEERRHFGTGPLVPAEQLSPCSGLHGTIAITSCGNVIPCLSMRDMILGNISEGRPFDEYFSTSEEYRKIINLRLSRIKPCADCKYVHACDHCPAQMIQLSDSIEKSPENFCAYARAVTGAAPFFQ